MRTTALVHPPYSMLQVMDPEIGEPPRPEDIGAGVTATATCVFVATLSEADGPVDVTLDDGEVTVPAGMEIAWSGIVETTDRIAVMTVEWREIMSVPTAGSCAVTVWANDLVEPDDIYLHVGSPLAENTAGD